MLFYFACFKIIPTKTLFNFIYFFVSDKKTAIYIVKATENENYTHNKQNHSLTPVVAKLKKTLKENF